MLCMCWTAAKRAPLAFRRIGDLKIPFTITFTQLLIGMGSFFLLFNTRNLWTWALPGMGVALVMGGAPILAAAAFGVGQVEGRTLPRYIRGLIRYQVGKVFRKDPSKQTRVKYHLRVATFG